MRDAPRETKSDMNEILFLGGKIVTNLVAQIASYIRLVFVVVVCLSEIKNGFREREREREEDASVCVRVAFIRLPRRFCSRFYSRRHDGTIYRGGTLRLASSSSGAEKEDKEELLYHFHELC